MPTLSHVRPDGTVVPVKVSIWDGFKGVPDPRPRKPKPCNCCGKIHPPKNRGKDVNNAGAKKGGGNNKSGNEAGGGGKNNYSTSVAETYSKADDAMITEMKANGKTWNEILAAIGKTSQSNLKQHWKDDLERPAAIEAGKKEGESKDEGDSKFSKKSKSEKKKDAAEWKAKQEGADKDKSKGGKEKGKGKKDDTASKEAAKTEEIREWAAGYDKKKWMALASKHYDRTGSRITAEQAKKMALGK